MTADSTPSQRLAGAWRDAVGLAASLPAMDARAIAIGWATVDLDRAAGELTAALGLRGDRPFRPAARSEVLGATCRVAAEVLLDGASLVVLEPDTEGRLAASLARFDEGPLATWLAVAEPAPGIAALGEAGLTVSSGRGGPFGLERLIVGRLDVPTGPHRLLVSRAAGTIHP